MTAKITANAAGNLVTIGNAVEDALQIDSVAKTIKALAPYTMAPGNSGPAFSAVQTGGAPQQTFTPGGVTLACAKVLKSTGGGYNSATSEFTVPLAGYYLFTWGATGTKISTNFLIDTYLFINGLAVARGAHAELASPACSDTGSTVIYCNLGDIVKVLVYVNTSCTSGTQDVLSRFSGIFLRAE